MTAPICRSTDAHHFAAAGLLLQGGLETTTVTLLVAVIAVVAVLLYVLVRSSADEVEESAEPQPDEVPQLEEGEEPTDLLEDREELAEPVDDYEDMSLAEVKRAKSARVESEGAQRDPGPSGGADEGSRGEPRVETGDGRSIRSPGEEDGETAASAAGRGDEGRAEDREEPSEEAARAESEPSVEQSRREAGPEEVEEEHPERAETDRPSGEEDEAEAPVEEDRPAGPGEAEDDQSPTSLEEGLERTREGFFDQLGSFFEEESLDEERVEEIEEFLFSADIGPRVAQEIVDAVEEKLAGEELEDPAKIWGFIRHYCTELLETHDEPLVPEGEEPYVVLVVGVNGVGKTTTIGKMASKFQREGHSCLLVAGDTFRAAAVEQLEIWADRTGCPMHQGEQGADPSSVVYSGIDRADEEEIDVVICDTSGRLHTDENLMEELSKMERVAGNAEEGAPHEVNLVLDANTGQNAIQQAEKFHDHLDISGLTLTKFDGTARGGVILGICKRFEAPVRYIGIGESVEDLREFDAEEFVEALFL